MFDPTMWSVVKINAKAQNGSGGAATPKVFIAVPTGGLAILMYGSILITDTAAARLVEINIDNGTEAQQLAYIFNQSLDNTLHNFPVKPADASGTKNEIIMTPVGIILGGGDRVRLKVTDLDDSDDITFRLRFLVTGDTLDVTTTTISGVTYTTDQKVI